ncbi:MAG: peptide synthetase, partial [Actinobacteria bacterium]|nr:peptide synthetase [Actinomycetota bacterium]
FTLRLMRLTNVAQMALPPGRVQSYVVAVDDRPGRTLPISYDQRLHVSQGDRPGSWMAVAFRLPAFASFDALAAAWAAVIARHGTFRTAYSRTPGGDLTLHEIDIVGGAWEPHSADEGQLTRDIIRAVFDEACRSFARPSHRLCVITPSDDDTPPTVVIGGDHAHLDMWSLLIVARDLIACLDDLGAGGPPSVTPVPAFAAHTALLEQMPPAPPEVIGRWADILAAGDGVLPRFPLPLGDLSHPRAEVVEVRDVLDAAETAEFEASARAHGVRMAPLAVSALAQATRDCGGEALRAVFPVHSRHDAPWHHAVGWFITNSVIECTEASPRAGAAAIKEALQLGSHPLAPILGPRAAELVTPGMFAISWLDSRRLPEVDRTLGIQYVSAVIETDGVMIWFLVGESGLHLRCRYPDTPEARVSVGQWLDAVQHRLRAVVSVPA